MSKVVKNNKKKNSGNIRKIYSYIFFFVIFLFVFYLFRLNILPSWVNIAIAVILFLVMSTLLFFINNRRVKDNIRIKSLIVSVILLIIFGTLDLAKAVIAGKEDEMKAAQKLLIKRLIYAVAVFLVATIVVVVMGLVNEGNDSAWWACWNNTSAKDIG